jgi:hypothetical protein
MVYYFMELFVHQYGYVGKVYILIHHYVNGELSAHFISSK